MLRASGIDPAGPITMDTLSAAMKDASPGDRIMVKMELGRLGRLG
jgi:hypothetical protein